MWLRNIWMVPKGIYWHTGGPRILWFHNLWSSLFLIQASILWIANFFVVKRQQRGGGGQKSSILWQGSLWMAPKWTAKNLERKVHLGLLYSWYTLDIRSFLWGQNGKFWPTDSATIFAYSKDRGRCHSHCSKTYGAPYTEIPLYKESGSIVY